jgi:hypothetical protein
MEVRMANLKWGERALVARTVEQEIQYRIDRFPEIDDEGLVSELHTSAVVLGTITDLPDTITDEELLKIVQDYRLSHRQAS